MKFYILSLLVFFIFAKYILFKREFFVSIASISVVVLGLFASHSKAELVYFRTCDRYHFDLDSDELLKFYPDSILAGMYRLKSTSSFSHEESKESVAHLPKNMPSISSGSSSHLEDVVGLDSDIREDLKGTKIQHSDVCDTSYEDGKSKETAFRLSVPRDYMKPIVAALSLFPVNPDDFRSVLITSSDIRGLRGFCRYLGLTLFEDEISTHLGEPTTAERMVLERLSQDLEEKYLGEYVELKGGTFQMGSPPNEPNRNHSEQLHQVTLSPFEFPKYGAISQKAYAILTKTNPSKFKEEKYCPKPKDGSVDPNAYVELVIDGVKIPMCPNHPVENVSWLDGEEALKKLNALSSNYVYRYPTEAELEFALRGETQSAFVSPTQAQLSDYIYFFENSKGLSRENQTHSLFDSPKLANGYGIIKASVMVWGSDWYDENYPDGPVVDPTGPNAGVYRLLRGCSWYHLAQPCRLAFRTYAFPEERFSTTGLAFVRTRKQLP